VADLDQDNITPRAAVSEPLDEELAGLLAPRFDTRKTAEREGLPPGYRMRADAHYVDQLSARSADVPMRLVLVDDIDSPDVDTSADPAPLRALTQSVAEHGVVQPLLVRRDGSRYRLIAGRKRLAAARAAGIARVACLVHVVDDAEAAALARAVDVQAASPRTSSPSAARPGLAAEILAQVGDAMSTLQSATTLLGDDASPMVRRVALELVRSATWRATWLLRAAAILERTHRWQFRTHLVGSVLARIRDGFAADARLHGIDVTLQVEDWNVTGDLDEDAFVAGISGAIVATAGLAGTAEARVVVIARRSEAGTVAIDVSQSAAAPEDTIDERFFDPAWIERAGGRQAAIGAAVAKAVADRHAGSAALIVETEQGSTLQIRIGRAAARH